MTTHRPATPEVLYGKGAFQFNVQEFPGAAPRLAPCWHPALPEVAVQDDYDALTTNYRTKPYGMWFIASVAWKMAVFALSIVLFPFTARAAEPCKVNLQTATPAQLALLPGIGEKTAALIAEAKPATLDELDGVKGIGAVKLAAITPHAAFGAEETTCTEKQKLPRKATGGTGETRETESDTVRKEEAGGGQ